MYFESNIAQLDGKNIYIFFRHSYLTLILLFLSIPVSITQILGVDIPLSVFALCIGFPLFFIAPNNKEKQYLIISMVFSAVSLLFNALFISKLIRYEPFLSYIYFYCPYFLFFSGYVLIRNFEDFSYCIRMFSYIFLFTSVVIATNIYTSGGVIRLEGELLGKFFNFDLYGAYGVNSLAVFFSTMLIIILIYLFFNNNKLYLSFLFFPLGIISLIFLLIGSLSREAILGLLFFIVYSIIYYYNNNKLYAIISMFALLFFFWLGIYLYGDLISIIWSGKVENIMNSINNQMVDFDDISSGRITLYKLAVEDIIKDPVFGNGFHGFQLYGDKSTVFESLIGFSPHNQYLTAVWKMGGIAAIFYFLFLLKCVKNTYCLKNMMPDNLLIQGIWILSLAYFICFCMFWDVLVVPLIGMFFMFIMGGISKLYSIQRSL